MVYISRKIEEIIQQTVQRGKSILLLGPRQTGKTTLITHQLQPDINYTFAKPEVRLRYEKDLGLLERELSAYKNKSKKSPLVFIDEVQKIPIIMDAIQDLIDRKIAQFILTGSSARKLKHGSEINLLPGRVVALTLDPLNLGELPEPIPLLEELLIYGSLPGIIEQPSTIRDIELTSYVTTYLEEEIRAEAVVRNVGGFARFLELAASESGNIMNFNKLSQEIGVAGSTIADYYQILEDCLIINRIDPIINSISHRRLIKSPKYLFFDLGIRRACAGEGVKLSIRALGALFEQFVGLP
jgi:predicted AAA+ superfamily ATPase